jgi:hypothetical protein
VNRTLAFVIVAALIFGIIAVHQDRSVSTPNAEETEAANRWINERISVLDEAKFNKCVRSAPPGLYGQLNSPWVKTCYLAP